MFFFIGLGTKHLLPHRWLHFFKERGTCPLTQVTKMKENTLRPAILFIIKRDMKMDLHMSRD